MSACINRTVLSGSSVNANGTTSHTCTFTAATAGNFLVAIVAGSVTFSTPTGWTLQVSAVNNTGLYVFTKTAGSGESSFSTTHNGSNYAIKGVVYEYPAGTTFINGNAATGIGNNGTFTTPTVTGLTGSYIRFSARSHGISNASGAGSASWFIPGTVDYDSYVPAGANSGVFLGIGTDEGYTGSSFSPDYSVSVSFAAANGEGVSFALSVTTHWVNRTILSGSSIDPNGTSSHTCSFTAATAGNFLVAVVAGSMTFSTPSGWTLLTSAVNNSGLYVFTKTASSGESSFSTTHNGTNYPMRGIVYEYPAGTTAIGSNNETGEPATDTGPAVSSLTGTYDRYAARSWNMNHGTATGDATWTLPAAENFDDYCPRDNTGTIPGIALSVAFDNDCTGSSFTPSSTYNVNNAVTTSGEGVAWAIDYAEPASSSGATTAWLLF